MKRILAAVLAIILSVQVFARPIDQAKLERINAFIAQAILDSRSPMDFTLELSDVRVDTATELLKAATAQASLMGGIFNLSGGVLLEGELLQVQLSASGYPQALGLGSEMIEGLVLQLEQLAERINSEEVYQVVITRSANEEALTLRLLLTGVGPDANPALRFIEIVGVIPAQLEDQAVTLSLTGEFNAQAEVVVAGQVALTNITNDLADGQEPSDEDLGVLGDILGAVLGDIL